MIHVCEGRMSMPEPATQVDMHNCRLCPRFAVVQGTQPDGKPKVRSVDHLSWWSDPSAASVRRLSKKRMKASCVCFMYWPCDLNSLVYTLGGWSQWPVFDSREDDT